MLPKLYNYTVDSGNSKTLQEQHVFTRAFLGMTEEDVRAIMTKRAEAVGAYGSVFPYLEGPSYYYKDIQVEDLKEDDLVRVNFTKVVLNVKFMTVPTKKRFLFLSMNKKEVHTNIAFKEVQESIITYQKNVTWIEASGPIVRIEGNGQEVKK